MGIVNGFSSSIANCHVSRKSGGQEGAKESIRPKFREEYGDSIPIHRQGCSCAAIGILSLGLAPKLVSIGLGKR
jgi:hypothetical protein